MMKVLSLLLFVYLSASQAQVEPSQSVEEKEDIGPITEEEALKSKAEKPINKAIDKAITEVKEWPAEIKTYTKEVLPNEVNQLGDKFYNELFNKIDDVTIFKQDKPKSNFRIQSNRSIYDNHDILSSWTVVDRLNINLSLALWSGAIPMGTYPSISLSLGAGGSLNYTNARRSNVKQYSLQAKLENLEKDVNLSLAEAKEDLDEEEDKSEKWYNLDPIRRAQYFEPLKRILIPLRIPYQASHFKWLQNGEIMAFDMSGTISVGAGIGFSTPSLGDFVPKFNAGLSYSTYLRGSYRYSLMKESEKFVRLKVTKVSGYGHGVSLGTNFDEKVVFQGFLVPVLNKVEGRQVLKINPFNFSLSKDYENIFDICYRYDLTNIDAALAYEEAMRGNLEMSEDLLKKTDGKPGQAIFWVFSRDAKSSGKRKNRRVELGFLFQKSDNTSVTNMEATIKLPDGESHVLRSISENSREWKSFAGHNEKIRYNFSFYYNRDLFTKKTDDSFSLIAEGFIDDYITTGVEMRHYSKLFELAVGAENPIYPRLPIFPPPLKEGECVKWDNIKKTRCLQKRLLPAKVPAFYSRSSFYFRLGFNRPMLEKFLAIPEDKIWPILETAFGVKEGKWDDGKSRFLYHTSHIYSTVFNVPLYLTNYHLRNGSHLFAAERFVHRLKKIREMKDPEKRLKKLAILFSNAMYGYEFINVLRLALPKTAIPYTITGSNKLFPNPVREEAWGVTIVDHVSAANRRDMDFETYQSTITVDDKALVNSLKITNLIKPIIVDKEKEREKKRLKKEEAERTIVIDGGLGEEEDEKEKKKKVKKKAEVNTSPSEDTEANVKDDKENEEDEDEPGIIQPLKVQVDIDLAIKPKYIYIKIVHDERWLIATKLSEVIIPGGTIIAGPQSIILTNEPGSGIGYDLLKNLKLGRPYQIFVSISQDGRIWGPAKSYSFRL